MRISDWSSDVCASDLRSGVVFNPSDGSILYHCAYASKTTLDHAVDVAFSAGRAWANASQARRLEVIFRMRQLVVENTDKLADLIGRENGKTIADAKGEIGRALEAVERSEEPTSELQSLMRIS